MYRLISPNHCPFCAEMAGKYPKDFKFWGWHPHCRCTTIPILKNWEQMDEDNERLILGQPISESPERILLPKESFRNWVRDNKDKIERAKVKPFFIQNNQKYLRGIVGGSEIKPKIENYKHLVNKKQPPVFFSDITGGLIANAIKLINQQKDNFQKVSILKEITQMRDFKPIRNLSNNKNTIYGFNIKQYDEILKQKEMPKNIVIAQKLLQNKYDVYLLPNVSGVKSADFIAAKSGKLFYFEAKTINGQSTIKQRLMEASTQSDRVILDIVGIDNGRDVANNIKWFFENNNSVKEVLILKNKRIIATNRQQALYKNFEKSFEKEWGRKK